MPTPRRIRTLLVALLVAALAAGVATPVHAKEPAAQKSERIARKAMLDDRVKGSRPAIVEVKGMVQAPTAPIAGAYQVQVASSNLAAFRSKTITVYLWEKGADKAVVTLANKPVDISQIQPGDRVMVKGHVKGAASALEMTGYFNRFDRTNPRPTKLQGKVTKVDPLTIFARGMETPITFATPTAIQVRNGKPVDGTNTIAVGDLCMAVGFPEGETLRAFYLNCKSTPPAKGKPATTGKPTA